ncbi:MAG TPA: glycosyltransferase family 87 protein [Candidatus Dormibacteraeota bacterium]|nr:glycosyltransferase family 87 protein [Candidatus Dormibacteraeota bacterium]
MVRAARDVFTRPAFYWVLAALFGLRVVILSIVNHQRPDAEGMWEGARAYLTNPSHMYDAAAQYLAASHVIAPPGTIYAFVSPPPVAVLAIPVALLPKDFGVQAWTVLDALALVAGLFVLFRVAGTKHAVAAPVFWVIAMYFPPVFADVSAGQRGGVALLGAMASIWFEARRPWVAGVLGGLVSALKYYPAAMIIGPRPAHRIAYALALGAALVVFTALTFIPLGFGGAVFYYEHVLLASLGSHNADCGYDSVRTLFDRVVGGEPYLLPASGGGVVSVSLPLRLPALAAGLSYASAVAFAGGAVWGAWRSGWNAPYGMALGFALGALIPNEVWPYQWLPVLPLLLLVAVRAIEQRRTTTLVLLGVFLLAFYRAPCDLLFPNLWTLGAIAIFVLGVWENRLFRSSPPLP